MLALAAERDRHDARGVGSGQENCEARRTAGYAICENSSSPNALWISASRSFAAADPEPCRGVQTVSVWVRGRKRAVCAPPRKTHGPHGLSMQA